MPTMSDTRSGSRKGTADPMTAMGLKLDSVHWTTEVVATTLPVDLPTDTWRTMIRQVVPVAAGDTLDVLAWARVTNDVGYTVGVGWHLWVYDCELGTSSTWTKISPSLGDNVTSTRHHMPLMISAVWAVPVYWPEGHRVVVVLRADAHSTAAVSGDTLTVDDGYGALTVHRYIPEV